MTVVKIVNGKQVSSYRINMDVSTLDMLLESFVVSISNLHGMNVAYGDSQE